MDYFNYVTSAGTNLEIDILDVHDVDGLEFNAIIDGAIYVTGEAEGLREYLEDIEHDQGDIEEIVALVNYSVNIFFENCQD